MDHVDFWLIFMYLEIGSQFLGLLLLQKALTFAVNYITANSFWGYISDEKIIIMKLLTDIP